MDINDRVKLLMKENNLSSSDFAEKTGIQQSTFSHFINGRNKASLDVVTKIHEAFPDVSIEWLLYGNGEMYTALPPISPNSMDLFEVQPEINYSDKNKATSSTGLTMESVSGIAPILNKQAELEAYKTAIKPPRKITEIRVFFDDNTYEIFHTEK